MGFLIRFAIKFCFWMMLVSLFIPPAKDEHGGNQPGPLEAFTAAREAIVDLGDFCNRKPQACETGKAAFANAGERAGDVAKAGYDYLDTQLGKDVPRPDAAVAAAHGDAKPVAGADAIKAKLRELALRELIEAADRQSEASTSVDKKAQTGTVVRN